MPSLARAIGKQGGHERLTSEFAARSLQDARRNAMLQAILGHAWLAQGKLDQARTAVEMALAADPTSTSALLGKARILALSGGTKEALDLAETVVSADARSADAQALKGELQLSLGRRDDAAASLVTALQIDPLIGHTRATLAALRIEQRRYDDRRSCFTATQFLTSRASRFSEACSRCAEGRSKVPATKSTSISAGRPSTIPHCFLRARSSSHRVIRQSQSKDS